MQYLSNKNRALKLLPLLSRDRSRDSKYRLQVGYTLVTIFGDNPDTLKYWHSVSIPILHSLCTEEWPGVLQFVSTYHGKISLRTYLQNIPDIDLDDIECVITHLERVATLSDKCKNTIDRLKIHRYTSVDKLLDQVVDTRGLIKYSYAYDIGTLEKWCSRDDPVGYKELLIKENYIDQSIYDVSFGTNTWVDTLEMIVLQQYDTNHKVLSILRLLRSSLAYIVQGKGMFITKDTNGISLCSKTGFLSSYTHIVLYQTERDRITLKQFIDDHWLYLKYGGITYYPGIAEKGMLNLFTRYEASICQIDNMDDINKILDHLYIILCNKNTAMYDYMLNWMSYVVQTAKKPGVAILMIGRAGIGKTLFWNWFIDYIIGKNNSFCAATLSQITGSFNSHISNVRVMLINEVKGTGKHDHDVLKTIITDPYIKLEKKGIDAMQISSSHCLICTSNHREHHFIDEYDRRFCVIECGDALMDSSYFTSLNQILERSSNQFYTFLMNRDIQSFHPPIYPRSEIRDELVETNEDSVSLFIKGNPWIDWMKASDIYLSYKSWCTLHGIKKVAACNQFKSRAGNLIETKKASSGNYYKLK